MKRVRQDIEAAAKEIKSSQFCFDEKWQLAAFGNQTEENKSKNPKSQALMGTRMQPHKFVGVANK